MKARGVKAWLRRLVLSKDERVLIEADRKAVLRAMLSPEQWRLVEALENATRYFDGVTFAKEEQEALKQFFTSATWAKVDVAMINWLQEQAQQAIQADPAAMVGLGKYAHGARAGFEMVKSISALAAANRSQSEDSGASTAAADLDQLAP